MDLVQSPFMGADAKAILRQALEPYGLGALADIAYQIQLSGVTDIDQILNYLQGSQAFQQRFPGLIDAHTGEQIATVADFVAYERALAQQMSTYGVTADDMGVPLNILVGNLLQARRSPEEAEKDLQAISFAKQNPSVRRDFYAITGIDAGLHGIAGMILGIAPNLEDAYAKATAQGVDVNTYLQRRYDFENKISTDTSKLADVKSQLGNLQLQMNPIQTQLATAQKSLQRLQSSRAQVRHQLGTASTTYAALRSRMLTLQNSLNHANHVGNKELVATYQAQIAATRAKMQSVMAQANGYRTTIASYDAKITASQTSVNGIQTKLNPYLTQQTGLAGQGTTLTGELATYQQDLSGLEENAPTQPSLDLLPGQLDQSQVMEAITRAQKMQDARFRTGGQGVVQQQPKVGQQSF